MSFSEAILPEFDMEMANTRKVLELLPDDKMNWRAHPKMRTIAWNANHLAEISGWVEGWLSSFTWDFAPVGGEPYQSPNLRTGQEILELFDRNVAQARKAIHATPDEEMDKTWSLLQGGNVIMSMPRSALIRRFVLNHTIHHRAHLLVYLRMNDISVPGMYDPSGK